MASQVSEIRSEAERKKALVEARRRVAELETPEDRLCRMCWFDMNLLGVMKTAIDLGLYKIMAVKKEPMHVDEIAKVTRAEPQLLVRLLRMLAIDNQVDEKDANLFSANSMTVLMARPEFEGMYNNCFDFMSVPLAFPAYLKDRGYKNPTNKDDSPWMAGMKTDKHYFTFIHEPGRESWVRDFEYHMTAKNLRSRPWFQTNNITEVLGTDTKAEDVLLVDIGGNLGGDIMGLREQNQQKYNGKVRGRLVLQDVPETIRKAKETLPADIEATVYDFFTPQPVQGARAYFMHMILHDWPNDKCVEILKNQASAMKRGHSKLLVNEMIIPDKGARWEEVGIDILMMGVHSATERSEAEWKALFESAGLKMVKIWDCDGESDKLIEVELA